MRVKVEASSISGCVAAPASKSAVQRYIAGALLAEGRSEITSVSLCDDSEAAMVIAESLGASISFTGNRIEVEGGFRPRKESVSCGESGLSARMFTPVAALHDSKIEITGRGSLMRRPFDMVKKPLELLGAEVMLNNGFLPLTVRGPLQGGEVTADGSVSSQFITGLLMALPVASGDSRIVVDSLVSRPYIDLTLRILSEFGISAGNSDYRIFDVTGGQKYRPGKFRAEGDWSGAAFLMVMGAIGGEVAVSGLDITSSQADRDIVKVLQMAGARVSAGDGLISVTAHDLHPFEFDISQCPDLAPPLTVLALACRGRSVIRGAERLASKESDRGAALEKTMNDIGGKVKNHGSYMEIEGGGYLPGGESHSFNDHRIAMALSAASLLCRGPVFIDGMDCINKSYPGFIMDYRRIGGKITTA